MLNVGYLQDQDAEYAKRQAEKDELQKKKNEAKKEREFQAECRNLWKMTALFVKCHSRRSVAPRSRKRKAQAETIPENLSSSPSEGSNDTSESKSDSWLYAPPSSPNVHRPNTSRVDISQRPPMGTCSTPKAQLIPLNETEGCLLPIRSRPKVRFLTQNTPPPTLLLTDSSPSSSQLLSPNIAPQIISRGRIVRRPQRFDD